MSGKKKGAAMDALGKTAMMKAVQVKADDFIIPGRFMKSF